MERDLLRVTCLDKIRSEDEICKIFEAGIVEHNVDLVGYAFALQAPEQVPDLLGVVDDDSVFGSSTEVFPLSAL